MCTLGFVIDSEIIYYINLVRVWNEESFWFSFLQMYRDNTNTHTIFSDVLQLSKVLQTKVTHTHTQRKKEKVKKGETKTTKLIIHIMKIYTSIYSNGIKILCFVRVLYD